jgi:chaperone modulatory protein CbpM
MRTVEQLCLEIHCSRGELIGWVEQRWIKPVRQGDDILFDEADAARARLIGELRSDMSIDDEAMPVVLGLLDQLYYARRTMAALWTALDEVAPEAKPLLARRLTREPG